MSHFSRIQTQIVDKPYLLQALSDLGFRYEEGSLQINGFLGQKAEVEILLHLENSYNIGLRRSAGKYEIVADWAGVRGLNRQDFSQRLAQRYAYHAARAKLESQGFTLVEETEQSSGAVHLVLRRISS